MATSSPSPSDTTPIPSQPSSQPPPSELSPSRKRSTSPPFADAVVRPFTSQGSAFSSPQSFNYPPPPRLSSNAHTLDGYADSPPSKSAYGPYTSASARTSYTKVDVDSLTAPVYPALPSLPSASTEPTSSNARANDNEPTPTPTPPVTTMDGSASNVATTPAEPPIPQTPQVTLTFLLVSGLRKTQSFDPETTVGRVKELVWNAWPGRDADWQDERPPAPSYLRILYLGKILQDDETLVRVGFPTSLPSAPSLTLPSPTIVHLSIRPYAPPSEDPGLNKKRRLSVNFGRRVSNTAGEPAASQEAESAGCCTGCVIC